MSNDRDIKGPDQKVSLAPTNKQSASAHTRINIQKKWLIPNLFDEKMAKNLADNKNPQF